MKLKAYHYYLISIGLTALLGGINGFLFPRIMYGESIFDGYYLGYYTMVTVIVGALVLASYYYVNDHYKNKKKI